MGKKRIVQPEDDDLLFENIKRSKLPLTARPGLFERTEYLRQIFQEEEKEYKLDWLHAKSAPFPARVDNFIDCLNSKLQFFLYISLVLKNATRPVCLQHKFEIELKIENLKSELSDL